MPLAKESFGALAPGAYKPIVQTGTKGRADQRNHASRPLLHDFGTGARRDTLDHSRNEFVDHLFLQQLAADVDSRRARGRDPELGDFIIGIELEAVNETQLLNGSHGNRRKNAEI